MPSHPDPENEILLSRKVLDMLTVANEFCFFLENAREKTKEAIMDFLQKICPLIYIKASLLPDISVENEDAIEHYVTEEQWEDIFNLLRMKFGEKYEYYYIDHHEKNFPEPVRASLAEQITDIYQDLKDFVLLYQNPHRAFRENAIRDCKYLFETRFGFRMVNALSAIHYQLYEGMDLGIMIE